MYIFSQNYLGPFGVHYQNSHPSPPIIATSLASFMSSPFLLIHTLLSLSFRMTTKGIITSFFPFDLCPMRNSDTLMLIVSLVSSTHPSKIVYYITGALYFNLLFELLIEIETSSPIAYILCLISNLNLFLTDWAMGFRCHLKLGLLLLLHFPSSTLEFLFKTLVWIQVAWP